MSPILLDAGCIVALLDRSERYHKQCAELVTSLDTPLVTCEPVIAESCYLLRGLKAAPAAVLENVERGVFLIPYLYYVVQTFSEKINRAPAQTPAAQPEAST